RCTRAFRLPSPDALGGKRGLRRSTRHTRRRHEARPFRVTGGLMLFVAAKGEHGEDPGRRSYDRDRNAEDHRSPAPRPRTIHNRSILSDAKIAGSPTRFRVENPTTGVVPNRDLPTTPCRIAGIQVSHT